MNRPGHCHCQANTDECVNEDGESASDWADEVPQVTYCDAVNPTEPDQQCRMVIDHDGDHAVAVYTLSRWPKEPYVPGDSGVAKVSRRIAELENVIPMIASFPNPERVSRALDTLNGELFGLRFALESITGVRP